MASLWRNLGTGRVSEASAYRGQDVSPSRDLRPCATAPRFVLRLPAGDASRAARHRPPVCPAGPPANAPCGGDGDECAGDGTGQSHAAPPASEGKAVPHAPDRPGRIACAGRTASGQACRPDAMFARKDASPDGRRKKTGPSLKGRAPSKARLMSAAA